MYNNRVLSQELLEGMVLVEFISENIGNEFVKKVYLVNSNFESSIKLSKTLN